MQSITSTSGGSTRPNHSDPISSLYNLKKFYVCNADADPWRFNLWRFDTFTGGWTSVVVNGAEPETVYSRVTSVGLDLWQHGGFLYLGEGDACSSPVVLMLLLR
jgi:hypothetical protein